MKKTKSMIFISILMSIVLSVPVLANGPAINQGTTGNKTLTAEWLPIDYTITYNLNGGTNASSNPSTYSIETPTFTLANPSRSGAYKFTGWSPSRTTITQGSTGNKTFTANWLELGKPVTLIIKGNPSKLKWITPCYYGGAFAHGVDNPPRDTTLTCYTGSIVRFCAQKEAYWDYYGVDDEYVKFSGKNSYAYFRVPDNASGTATLWVSALTSTNSDNIRISYSNDDTSGWVKSSYCYPVLGY